MTELDFKLKVFSLAERLLPMVTRMLGDKARAEDAIQEIMMKLWERRYKIDDHPNITGLVFLTARNYCIDRIRTRKVNIVESTKHLERLPTDHGREQSEWVDLNKIIKKILNDIPDQQREVLIMRDLEGYEYLEIAASLQLNVKHVRVLLSRARKQVSNKLEEIYRYEQK